MRKRALGRSRLQVSEVALGSWLTLGTRVDVPETTRLVQCAFDLGINLFDTADVYQDGDGERALGKAIQELPREALVLATKCFFAMSSRPEGRGLSRKHILESVDGSLRRLGTDYLDLHQCHRFDPDTPLEETIGAYGELIQQGKLLYWGVSHWTAAQIQDACHLADDLNLPRPISSQPEYSILVRDIERQILSDSAEQGLSQIVFSPLAQGALTGKYGGGRIPKQSRANDPKRNRWMGSALDADVLARIDRLRPLAEQLDVEMSQLALAWCLRKPEVASVIVGATRLEHLEENVRAVGLAVPREVEQAIDALFPLSDRAG